MFLKSSDGNVMLPTIPSVDIDETLDILHHPLAPLASSETFTDVAALIREDQQKEEEKGLSVNNDLNSPKKESSIKIITPTTKTAYDSLEVLFDFPSSSISTDTQLEVVHTSQSANRIRFADNDQIISTNKV
jgi:hypothetical protein